MSIPTPSFIEDHDSQIPAIQLLTKLGYEYLTPAECLKARNRKNSNVILEEILAKQLRKINAINFKGKSYEFSENNVQNAITSLKEIRFDGLVRTNELVYDLLTLGRSFEQTIDGDKKSFSFNFIDWKNPDNNVYHVSEEFEVERTASNETRRPDIILFVNGIPLVVIECKRRDMEKPLDQAISQQIRNQKTEEIPKLFIYSQLLLALSVNEAKYATAGTSFDFWSVWREQNQDKKKAHEIVNKPLDPEVKENLFKDRFRYVKQYFDTIDDQGDRTPTAQDYTLLNLCSPERLLEITYQFTVFDKGIKKVARYQQYFSVKNTINRVRKLDRDGNRKGGVIWHTQGSGKSITIVMLAKALSLCNDIQNPKIIIVTDRKDLDKQIERTFRSCGKEVVRAKTGKHLTDILQDNDDVITTTILNKFRAVLNKGQLENPSKEIFVLVDESHRSQYGSFNVQMQQVFPNACYIGFTGTPLLKRDKNTANKFGGIIAPPYTIDQAVKDKAVVPLLYEGRHAVQEVNQKPMDLWFDRISETLTKEQQVDLKRKFSSADQLNQAEQKIRNIAYDVSMHYKNTWQGTGFKAQLTAPSKLAALKYKKYLDEFGFVSSELLISGPDDREGYEDIYDDSSDEIIKFWKKMMEIHGSEDRYNENIIDRFTYHDNPEVIIVVDKLLTGFDAPCNTVLYITRSLKDHTLLQAVARVNRLSPGKEYGYIIDYYGILGNLDKALTEYDELSEFDQEDIGDTLESVNDEVGTVAQKHSDLWALFSTIQNKLDIEAYELHLADEVLRKDFYEKLSKFARALHLALSNYQFVTETPKEEVNRYKKDLKFFTNLRKSVQQRYSEIIDYGEYEEKIQKLIDTYVTSDEMLQLTELVNIFDKEKFEEEVSKLGSDSSKADTIASRTAKTISENMQEDPVFYEKFSKLLQQTIDDWKSKRISDAEYLNKVRDIMDAVRNRTGDETPEILRDHEETKAFYGILLQVIGVKLKDKTQVAAEMALAIDQIVNSHIRVDWTKDNDATNEISNSMDDFLFETKAKLKIDISTKDMDTIIERTIEVAKVRYQR